MLDWIEIRLGCMLNYDWNDVRIFLAVAEAGSLAKAAERLSVSVATVSRRLEALEAALGQRLFDRRANRVELTAVARTLVPTAQSMGEGADAIGRLAQDRAAQGPEIIRMTATMSMSRFLSQHLSVLRAACPSVVFEISGTRAKLSLPQREADIALRMRRPPASGDLIVRKLGSVGHGLYASAGYLRSRPIPVTPSNLGTLEVIGSLRLAEQSNQEQWIATHIGSDRIIARLSEGVLRDAAAEAGMGALLAPCVFGERNPQLVRIVAPIPALQEDVFVLVHRDLIDVPRVRQTVDALVLLFKAEAAVLGGVGCID
jgi:DNA-binding transcriptional LysR family regulator